MSANETDVCPAGDDVRMRLVERTYSDDEQNMEILTHATPGGERYLRKERAPTAFTDVRDTATAVGASPSNVWTVDDPDDHERYAVEATQMSRVHDPDDVI